MKKITLLLLTILIVSFAEAAKKPKYIFYFIGDGMGHNQIALTEAALAAKQGRIGYEALNFTKFPAVGFITTNAATRLTTCSAAAGTALATGTKTSIGTIGMNADHTANLESVAVKAKNKGMKVGITTSVSIDHATPAAFYAHAEERGMSYEIAEWTTKAGFDLYASSGLLKPEGRNIYEIVEENSYSIAREAGTERRSIYEILAENGYSIARGAGVTLSGSKVFWEQDSKYNPASLPLAIESKKGDLTLSEITEKSIQFLDNKKGFFLMVEGGQIDWAGHANDAASIIHETKDFADAIEKALEFYRKNPTETLIVVTADHETSGVALGYDKRKYDTNLEYLFEQKMSKEKLEEAIEKTQNWEEAKALLKSQMGFWETIKITPKEELELLIAYDKKKEKAGTMAIEMIAHKSGVAYTTGSHTATFVPIFAIGACSEQFNGAADNTDVPKRMKALLD